MHTTLWSDTQGGSVPGAVCRPAGCVRFCQGEPPSQGPLHATQGSASRDPRGHCPTSAPSDLSLCVPRIFAHAVWMSPEEEMASGASRGVEDLGVAGKSMRSAIWAPERSSPRALMPYT